MFYSGVLNYHQNIFGTLLSNRRKLSSRSLFFNRPRFGSTRAVPPPPKKFGNPGDRLRRKKWDLDQLPKFEKNFYNEHPEVHCMSQVITYHAKQRFFQILYNTILIFVLLGIHHSVKSVTIILCNNKEKCYYNKN